MRFWSDSRAPKARSYLGIEVFLLLRGEKAVCRPRNQQSIPNEHDGHDAPPFLVEVLVHLGNHGLVCVLKGSAQPAFRIIVELLFVMK